MDSYSGSEPRLFISFRLDNESNGRPFQLNTEGEERMDTSESFVTASSHTGSPSLIRDPQNSQEEMGTAVNVPSTMNIVVDPLIHSAETGVQTTSQDEFPQAVLAEQFELTFTPLSTTGSANVESSSTDESCGIISHGNGSN